MIALIEYIARGDSKQLIAIVYSKLLIIERVFDQPLNEWNIAIPPNFSIYLDRVVFFNRRYIGRPFAFPFSSAVLFLPPCLSAR